MDLLNKQNWRFWGSEIHIGVKQKPCILLKKLLCGLQYAAEAYWPIFHSKRSLVNVTLQFGTICRHTAELVDHVLNGLCKMELTTSYRTSVSFLDEYFGNQGSLLWNIPNLLVQALDWPPYSWLTPVTLFLWGTLKDIVCRSIPPRWTRNLNRRSVYHVNPFLLRHYEM
ncbi:hypothetical protein AVEN_171685-1 [Araneus ventricosus]|uniref:Uncharacterized protein n=1 Tax=Araneus ventricosus TaxID=182803 RepID=A0A4Y2TUD7_ARAVE|nr:hypothetical protein AVEN_171685-1 [Araneus ventricosus]